MQNSDDYGEFKHQESTSTTRKSRVDLFDIKIHKV